MTIPQTLRINALDVPAAAVEADALRLLAARVDPETRHQLLDLDTDSTCRPAGFACPACPPKGVDSDG
ncbi:hypothetical protein GCM10010400_76160 [Streptomyces aculeolatus]|uniref:hypothetical protein n=1 Tax=Streptomyces aculeolatus TaxID=270689 RepID=UPI001CED965D|nr:hypothetical protein [Streptomyces aculeolatus]